MVRTNIIFGYDAYAWYAGRSLRDYYLDKQAAWGINRLARARIAETFGWQVGVKMPYLAYASLTALGAAIAYPPDGQPMVASPIIRSPADLDALPPLGDITKVGAVAHLIDMWRYLSEQEGETVPLSFGNEAPVTAAVLLRGTDFLTDAYENPAFAHRLLARLTELFILTARTYRQLTGQPPAGGEVGMADDFAGLLSPAHYRTFVIPYYNRIYEEMGAQRRSLHSELLRPEHLPLLAEFKLDHFDPHVDQYLSVRDMVEKMPRGIGWNWRILSANVVTGKPEGLVREFEEAVDEGASDFHVAISAPVRAENVRAVAEVGKAHGELTVS
jgi:hypothetical protein